MKVKIFYMFFYSCPSNTLSIRFPYFAWSSNSILALTILQLKTTRSGFNYLEAIRFDFKQAPKSGL